MRLNKEAGSAGEQPASNKAVPTLNAVSDGNRGGVALEHVVPVRHGQLRHDINLLIHLTFFLTVISKNYFDYLVDSND